MSKLRLLRLSNRTGNKGAGHHENGEVKIKNGFGIKACPEPKKACPEPKKACPEPIRLRSR